MGDNKSIERSFRELNELWDQKDAPQWENRRVALSVRYVVLLERLDDGAVVRREYAVVQNVTGKHKWIIPRNTIPAVVEGLRMAVRYEHPNLESSPNGHVVRRIFLNFPIPEAILPTAVQIIGHVKERAKIIIAAKIRGGRNQFGIRASEKLVCLATETGVVMLPIASIDSLSRHLHAAYAKPPKLSILGNEREVEIGTVE